MKLEIEAEWRATTHSDGLFVRGVCVAVVFRSATDPKKIAWLAGMDGTGGFEKTYSKARAAAEQSLKGGACRETGN